MPKNIKEIMIALNQVLTTTVWVNEDRQIVSLADELKIGKNNMSPKSFYLTFWGHINIVKFHFSFESIYLIKGVY